MASNVPTISPTRDARRVDRQAELEFVDELVVVEPGQVAQTSIRLRNTSDRVMHYALRPVPSGPAASWLTIAPESIRLLEGDDGRADVFIRPPSGAQTSAGRVAFAIMADPGSDSGLLPTVAEADVAVGAIHALDAHLVPSRSRGRLSGKLRAEFVNLGNEEVRISVSGSDESDNELLHFASADGRVAVPSGGAAAAFMKVRPDKPIFVGKPVDHPFVVTYTRRSGRSAQLESAASPEIAATLNGAFTQKPIVSKWMMVVGVLMIALAAIVFVVRQATAADPVPAAPQVPKLADEPEQDETGLILLFDVSDNPDHVEVELVDPPPDGRFDLAKPKSDPFQSEGDGSTRRVTVPLERSDDSQNVVFRFRSVGADGRMSIWDGESVVKSSSIAFETPVILTTKWSGAEEVTITWTTPSDADGVTLDYKFLNADTSEEIDVERVPGPINTARIRVPGEPFAIQVQAFDKNDPTRVSDFSEATVPPADGRPEQSGLVPPVDVTVDWLDSESVIVRWKPREVVTGQTFELYDETGAVITIAESPTATSAVVNMPSTELVFGIRVGVVLRDNRRSEPSVPAFPRSERPAPSPPSTPAPTTVAPAPTDPQLPAPQGSWILPQGVLDADQNTRVMWTQARGGLPPISFVVAETNLEVLYDSDRLTQRLSPDKTLWAYDGFDSFETARAACRQLLDFIVTEGLNPQPPECWAIGPGPGEFERVLPQSAPVTT